MELRGINQWHNHFNRTFDAERVCREATAIYRLARWNSMERLHELAGRTVGRMKQLGLVDAEVIVLPADGKTSYGGWLLPLAWSPRKATLELETNGCWQPLADYRKEPMQLILFSKPVCRQVAELVLINPQQPDLAAVRNRVAFVDGVPNMDLARRLMLAGARGLVTDRLATVKGIKEGPALDDAVQFYNYVWPPWRVPARERGFGFALSPNQGRVIREHFAAGTTIRVRVEVDASLAPELLPVITGRLPGRSVQDIIITGHIDEPGANDNASGPAMALEICRVLAEQQRRGLVLERGVRVIFSIETRGLQALLNERPAIFRHAVLGLNLDMVGCDQQEVLSTLKAGENYPSLPDFGYPLMARLLHRLQRRCRGFQWGNGFEINDNGMGEPAVGVPTIILEQAPDKNYHSSLDRPECLSPRAIKRLGTVIGTHVGFMATAGPAEIRRLGRINFEYSRERLTALLAPTSLERFPDPAAFTAYHVEKEKKRLTGLTNLLTDRNGVTYQHLVRRQPPKLNRQHLNENTITEQHLADLARKLEIHAHDVAPSPAHAALTRTAGRTAAERLVPHKLFTGYFSGEGLRGEDREKLAAAIGGVGWGAPRWLQWALAWSNGKRTLATIQRYLAYEGLNIPEERLIAAFDWLARHGYVKYRRYLVKSDLQAALRRVGVGPGMLLMTHCSLSQFGYIDGGETTLITALLAALGPRGTLAMPTHSLNWLGRAPYDPRHSPAFTGAVPNVFLQWDGVLRSEHPSHSVAVRGPLAQTLINGHNFMVAPLAREGFWGHFVDHDGWVLMLAPLRTNTLLHSAETWNRVPAPSTIASVRVNGRWRPVVLPNAPYHVHWFDAVHDELRRTAKLQSTQLGESQIHLMRARDAIAVASEIIRRDPGAPILENCTCGFCTYMREHLST